MERDSKKDLIVTLSVLLAIVFIVTGVLFTYGKKPAEVSTGTTLAVDVTASTPVSDSPANTVTTSGFVDGTYVATARYSTPESTERIKVSITLEGGIVTNTTAEPSFVSHESKDYAKRFVENYKPLVVGKKIDKLKLSRVSGSSLTSQGFNDAINQIKDQAKG